MSEERAKAQGVFIPNWWLAILLVPLAGGVIWVVITLTRIQAVAENIQSTTEWRMNRVERDTKLNDEHLRQLENRISRIEGKRGVAAPVEPEQ